MIFPSENSRLKSSVENFISARRIPHAIMIEGEDSELNISLGLYIASSAVCDGDSIPCGVCHNCHLANAGSHPDITRVSALDGKKFLSVAQIRELRADAFVKAHQASHRVFIIEDAHRMNEQAQNALLKVLEEPPASVVFILLVPSKTMLLDTIVSRCVLLGTLTAQADNSTQLETANSFIDLLLSGSEYEMLKLLSPLEKSRADAEEFFSALALCIAQRIKSGTGHARVLDRLFDDTKYYLDLLATNINMPLLISVAVSRSKGLLDK